MQRLQTEMAPKDLDALREMPADDLGMLHFGLGMFIRNQFGLNQGNDKLADSAAPDSFMRDPDTVSGKIVEALWKRLRSGA